jgi:hypothetical protein
MAIVRSVSIKVKIKHSTGGYNEQKCGSYSW